MTKIYTIDDLCKLLGGKITRRTIYGLTSSKRIPHFKVGKEIRFTQEHIDEYIRSTEVLTEDEDIKRRAIKYCAQHPLPRL
jgi:excisionase family DNA binding protein